MADGQSADEPHWIEAENLFNKIYYEINKNPEKSKFYEGLGPAYEKVTRRYLFLKPNDQEQARGVIFDQAVNSGNTMDRYLSTCCRTEERAGSTEQVERWLLRGLDLCPRSGELWKHYYLRKVKAGELDSVPQKLGSVPRGINNVCPSAKV